MLSNYSFLKDELAVLEIRKHQWIESQKKGAEIGFASAAVDWIKQYGNAWKQFRLETSAAQNPLTEKRTYRRFSYSFPLELKVGGQSINSQTQNISLVGFSCEVGQFIPDNTKAQITINLPHSSQRETDFRFESRVVRVHPSQNSTAPAYSVFVPFNENVRDYIRTHSEVFSGWENN